MKNRTLWCLGQPQNKMVIRYNPDSIPERVAIKNGRNFSQKQSIQNWLLNHLPKRKIFRSLAAQHVPPEVAMRIIDRIRDTASEKPDLCWSAKGHIIVPL